MKTRDICKCFSGTIEVNLRYICLRELHNKKSSTRARAIEGIDPPSPTKEQLKMMIAARYKEIAARDKELEQLQRKALEDKEDILSDSSME